MNIHKARLKKWYDETAQRYDSWGEREGEFDSGSRFEEIRKFNEILDKIKIKKDSKILDVATGTGIFLIEALKRGGIGYGIDISPNIISVLKNKIKERETNSKIKEIKESDASKLKFNENYFDLIICIGLFDYYDFPDIKIFLDEMKRVGTKKCYFIVDFENNFKIIKKQDAGMEIQFLMNVKL